MLCGPSHPSQPLDSFSHRLGSMFWSKTFQGFAQIVHVAISPLTHTFLISFRYTTSISIPESGHTPLFSQSDAQGHIFWVCLSFYYLEVFYTN
jgi:hypothetical protein